ncbi:TIM-barrel domain-containing protein [Diplocloster hominis]|uniref:glycoside hydrolase family 31 protein n=1 Tax=Diplocloster hominis TaxID=3079010 RepID=UPI0031B9E78E
MSAHDMKRTRFTEKSAALTWPLPDTAAALAWREEGDRQGILTVRLTYKGAYGMGEKYDAVNQKGHTVSNGVEEKFCYQGEKTYLPAPFFWTDSGFGLYADTCETTTFAFGEDQIKIYMPSGCETVLFAGTPEEIIRDYMNLFGKAKIPPKWVFGPWISANHWNSQAKIIQQIEELQRHKCPASVLVAEAWSDEATFYIFNGARYKPRPDGKPLSYEDFDFSQSPWPDPKYMLDRLHKAGLHFILWQVPVYKKQGEDEAPCVQNDMDREDAVRRGLCVRNSNGTPYAIPPGHWFSGSMVPDFENQETVRTWFAKRQYLLDIGVDGFKTDGGEFIYKEDIRFANGDTGREGKNRYAQSYTEAYTNFLGRERTLFSRAGYAGQHTTPCHWAGDQQSVNSELTGALRAGLSAALTGIPFWGFDIAGFAGPLPTPDLYSRATMLACFCPIMQWHSEPDGGQFRELMPGGDGNNERSPWNLEAAWGIPGFAEKMCFWHRLRMNLVPYLYSEALRAAQESRPMLRPLIYEWPKDPQALTAEDEFLLGESLLAAPLLEENQTSRAVYLPRGDWYSLFTEERFEGGRIILAGPELRFPVFLRSGTALILNLPPSAPLGTDVGNQTDEYAGLQLILAGRKGAYSWRSQPDTAPETIEWNETGVKLPPDLRYAEVKHWI